MSNTMEVLDLFSAAAGGWSLGMHRAGFETIAACEFVDWRRALYQQNNPKVRIYDDVRTLTADQLLRDFGRLPSIVVGSPPCQDISSANTKGKGVEGERSGLYFQAVRIIGEVRPRWFALENSSNLRTRGADAVLAALEALGYSCWTFVVRAGDIGANHERPRCWIIGCDLDQVADAGSGGQWQQPRRRDGADWSNTPFDQNNDPAEHVANTYGDGWRDEWRRRRSGLYLSLSDEIGHTAQDGCGSRLPGGRAGSIAGAEQQTCRDARNANSECGTSWVSASANEGLDELGTRRFRQDADDQRGDLLPRSGDATDADQTRQANGCMVAGIRQAKISDDGRGLGWSHDGQISEQMAVRPGDRFDPSTWRSDWSLYDLAGHLRLDDGLSPWLAGTRIAIGGPRGTSAASLIVEAFGDAVVPQIPEAIGKAILRTEAALSAIYGRAA